MYSAKAERIRFHEARSGAPGNRTPLVKSLVVSDSLLIFQLNKSRRTYAALRKDFASGFEVGG